MPEFYGEVKGLIDELEMHQPSVTDATTLKGYRQDLTVSKFLSGLSLTLRSPVRGQILGDNIPTLNVTFSRVMRVSLGQMFSLHLPLSSLPWFLNVVVVVVVTAAAILEEEDEDLLEVVWRRT